MTRSLSKRVISAIMAFVVLILSVSISVDLHYCQERLQSFSLVGKAKSCFENEKTQKCNEAESFFSASQKQDFTLKQKGCCHNESLLINQLDESVTSCDEYILETPLFLCRSPQFLSHSILDFSLAYCSHGEKFKPPIAAQKLFIKNQTFLI